MDSIQIITKLIEDQGIVTIATSVVTIFSVVAAAIPTPKEGTFCAKLFKFVDFLALNVLHAKDKGK